MDLEKKKHRMSERVLETLKRGLREKRSGCERRLVVFTQ